MRRWPDSFDASVSAFREMTGATSEASATRARVLARAERAARRRGQLRRGVVPLAVVLASLLSGAALTAGLHWRTPVPAVLTAPKDGTSAEDEIRPKRPTRILPPVLQESSPADARDVGDGEALAYERAHRVHFFADAPARALAAWDAYLGAYPRGTFAPEARYNRALCLARLGRFSAAADGLRPFAAGRPGSYRRQEACTLLRWLAERDARVAAAPDCPGGG